MPRKKVTTKKSEPTPIAPPSHVDERERETVIMFVDIMGASEVSNHKSLKEYWKFVNAFQNLFRRVCDKYITAWYDETDLDYIQHTERGDEGLIMFYRQTGSAGVSGDIDAAINIALELKREWICLEENSARITDAGLLPVNLAVGIHAGRTYLDKVDKTAQNQGGWLPEGYAINLAKRVESYSRQGRFTHIFLSEAAHGYLNLLPDEKLYLFDNPQVFSPKGISRDIRVYEVKHHFLPSDWKEQSETSSARAKTLLEPSCVNIEILRKALRINPTNIWLVEEFIRSCMLTEYVNMTPAQREDEHFIKKAFGPALEEANRLAQGDQRDAGALFLQGLIEGERGDYADERARYDDAIEYTDQLAEAYWYKGLSYSYQIWDETDNDLEITKAELDKKNPKLRGWADHAIECFRKAKIRRSHSAWIPFDYGCEIIRWSQTDEEITEGIEQIELAVNRLDDVRYEIQDQDYLKKVLDDPRIIKLLPKQDE